MNNKQFTYISTFSGIGGFELGINRAYANTVSGCSISEKGTERKGVEGQRDYLHSPLVHEPSCLGYSEIDKYAASIYQKHFPTHHNYGDITKLDASSLPDFDFLCGGFPCQAFSIAGKRGGFSDTRGTLFFDLARILKAKQPRLFLFENVKGLLSHDNGKTFATIIATLDELGYDLQWQVLNSKNHGVPQNRERIFIVGHLRGTPRPQVFPFSSDDGANHGLQRHVANTLTRRYEGAQAVGTYIGEGQLNAQEVTVGTLRTHKDGEGFRGMASGVAPTLNSRPRQDGSQQPVILTGNPSYKDGERSVEYKESDTVPTIRATHYKSGDNQPVVSERMRIRRLTPVECERLQGFPDGWTSEGINGPISDTQRYKTLGNAVTVNVIEAIIARIFESL